jgi:phosphate transport system permease protein
MIGKRGLYSRRRFVNALFLGLSVCAALFGIAWLTAILAALISKGVVALSPTLFTESTPPPTMEGGLANAIVGSLLMSALAVGAGTPIGIFAGTYLAEYGRYTKTAFIVRFVNDIMLSAPSIVIGLFVYVVMVSNENPSWLQRECTRLLVEDCPTGHFSGWAGSAALMALVIPVVVRTTELQLLLVPHTLREAAAALGAPRNAVIRAVTWKAARAGIITGVLLAIARISGETAPLLFTAFGNNFWSTNLSQPMANLPIVIFNFAMSPYEGWHHLAWAAALLVTAAVLTLSIVARALGTQRSR